MSAVPVRRLLLLLLLFVALTMPLTWLWLEWGEGIYVGLLLDLLDPLYQAMGLRPQRAGPLIPRLVSIVPLTVLMAITPGLGWRRRVAGILVGLLVCAVFHLLLFVLVDAAYAALGNRPRARQTKIVPFLQIYDGIPVLVWVFFARDFLRDLVPALAERAQDASGPPASAG